MGFTQHGIIQVGALWYVSKGRQNILIYWKLKNWPVLPNAYLHVLNNGA